MRSLHNFNLVILVILVSFDGAGSGALGSCLLLDLGSRGVTFLWMSVIFSKDFRGTAYLEDSDDLEKFFRGQLFLRPLLEWKWSRLARNDVKSSKCS
jgi:hypothetical protein